MFALHRANVADHGDLFHRWQNTPYVAEAWNEAGSREEHDAWLRNRRQDPHIEPLIGTLDGTPFAYLEVYWAREDRIGPYCEPGAFDQGLHLLVGEPTFLGGPLTSAWMRATFHFLFLREPRTRRLVGEPDAGHERVLRRLRETGWRKRKEFDFPHKRAALVTLDRDRFFGGQRP
ncbi:MAG: N-acetyltransferase [Proteobacteria bacterium SW_6_67_9]|nr:MAG: N-acetyltransferase [Proteobacteria bacterium SW_6_67_9]